MNLNETSQQQGHRLLTNGHTTTYLTYEGVYLQQNTSSFFRVIGEVWNCGYSGTSVVCCGYAFTTGEDTHQLSLEGWCCLVQDAQGTIDACSGTNGLLDHVHCH